MKIRLRRYAQTLKVLDEFLSSPKTWLYGYDLYRNTGIKSGTLYPILIRLAERGWLETRWEATGVGKPPRHMHRITPSGAKNAREMVCGRSNGLTRKLMLDRVSG